ncbi:MAG: DUF4007 family protein [Cyclobacteriaceae bacterium]|nr:DUF4007 family protein [Cyclobacteriaceae bacterium]
MGKLQFSGHESFHCRQFWLKKGFDFIQSGKRFSEESAVVDLGVGKNMVTSIRFWMRSFDLLDEKDRLTSIAKKLFDDNGFDPYLEDEGTLWLLHYHLTKNNLASSFNLIFTQLRKSKPEFERRHFYALISDKGKFSEATLTKDYSVFQNTYVASMSNKSEIEDSFSGILTELDLVTLKRIESKTDLLIIESKRRPEIPSEIILYAILENEDYGNSINFEKLLTEPTSVGTIFALNREGLTEKLEEITKHKKFSKNVVFKNEAGIRELQFSSKPKVFDVLAHYYDR